MCESSGRRRIDGTFSTRPMTYDSSWPMIESAVAGGDRGRQEFTSRYLPVVRAYLGARWRGGHLLEEIDDAVQDVFVECFRESGALQGIRAARDEHADFRGYLLGVVRNVARRFEAKEQRQRERQPSSSMHFSQICDDEATLSRVFDQAFARNVMRQAAALQREEAKIAGPRAERRVEILRLRFYEGMPIRDIATLWGVPAARMHHEYAKAREEFRHALRAVVGADHQGSDEALERECGRLLDLLE